MLAMWRIRLLLTLLNCLSGCMMSLVATTEWQNVKKQTKTSLPDIPYTLQIETKDTTDEDVDDLLILLENPSGHIQIQVVEKKFELYADSNCLDVTIGNIGNGIWTIKVDTTTITFSLNGEFVTSYSDNCFMNSVRGTKEFQFAQQDDISQRFRLQPDPCTAVAYPSDWSHVKPMIEGKETDAGMKVTVECEAPRVNRGSSDVTCKTGDQWEFGEKPDCLLQCTGFSTADLPNMFSPSLPVFENTVLEVRCFAGTFQLGGDHVTCVSGDKFSSDTKPDCREIGNQLVS